ncbi:MAG: quinone-dependent dihydroorotate dehydrogenase [Nitrosomonas sp.]|nr:quinone-dependent dihydroorotate dehydrogenase [Nitrosomonas sp.]
MRYNLLRPLLFLLDPETAHTLTLESLGLLHHTGISICPPVPCEPVHVMGITFPNPVGLAAGLDKNGAYLDALAALGFGFIEIGTVTPRSQPGNSKPRLFRIPEAQAIINRMGFNNEGVDKLLANVASSRYRGILGINIGKNADTPLENAVDDYLICLRKVYRIASYITINISSPNTAGLRQLQQATELDNLLRILKNEQTRLSDQHGHYTPLAIKIAPDMEPAQTEQIARLLIKHHMDAVIATNTTISRDGLESLQHINESGGLSGTPLAARSNAIIQSLAEQLQGAVPIIGVGGIMQPIDAQAKINAGASLVQLYSGLVYRGPALVTETVRTLCRKDTHD